MGKSPRKRRLMAVPGGQPFVSNDHRSAAAASRSLRISSSRLLASPTIQALAKSQVEFSNVFGGRVVARAGARPLGGARIFSWRRR